MFFVASAVISGIVFWGFRESGADPAISNAKTNSRSAAGFASGDEEPGVTNTVHVGLPANDTAIRAGETIIELANEFDREVSRKISELATALSLDEQQLNELRTLFAFEKERLEGLLGADLLDRGMINESKLGIEKILRNDQLLKFEERKENQAMEGAILLAETQVVQISKFTELTAEQTENLEKVLIETHFMNSTTDTYAPPMELVRKLLAKDQWDAYIEGVSRNR